MIDIICIEDEEVFRRNLTEILEAEGYKVKAFSDGAEALNYMQSPHEGLPKIVICDINLPQVSGYEFVRRIKMLDSQAASIPVIYLSAMGQKQDIVKGMALNVADYLIKPIDFDILTSKVKSLMG
ncbi:putative two-component response regulator receiver protein [endosymbiont of Acanthamoeba sp. UWC8]|uniref:response regulator transcription factor n=1 Tax=endosymbiont of Acanthamoeba sp. UWC8 TaxID=86106 RepID=UPI0004D181D3|nr:response regulator [endosymbiont of Acanthamoeba sp. UWC8]AIF80915.1 putative two-component response regulator receiver protein [endosymbiont of Acanthamoeba sp. UWC8]